MVLLGCFCCFASPLQYDMNTLLFFVGSELSSQLRQTLTLACSDDSPTSVFKWLVTADTLQLDSLKDICINALGTYLLPSFHRHAANCQPQLRRLSSGTVSDIVVATARCTTCLSVRFEEPCAATCHGRRTAAYPASSSPSTCCGFKLKGSSAQPYVVCGYCRCVRL